MAQGQRFAKTFGWNHDRRFVVDTVISGTVTSQVFGVNSQLRKVPWFILEVM